MLVFVRTICSSANVLVADDLLHRIFIADLTRQRPLHKDGRFMPVVQDALQHIKPPPPDSKKPKLKEADIQDTRDRMLAIYSMLAQKMPRERGDYNEHLGIFLCYELSNFQEAKTKVQLGSELAQKAKNQYRVRRINNTLGFVCLRQLQVAYDKLSSDRSLLYQIIHVHFCSARAVKGKVVTHAETACVQFYVSPFHNMGGLLKWALETGLLNEVPFWTPSQTLEAVQSNSLCFALADNDQGSDDADVQNWYHRHHTLALDKIFGFGKEPREFAVYDVTRSTVTLSGAAGAAPAAASAAAAPAAAGALVDAPTAIACFWATGHAENEEAELEHHDLMCCVRGPHSSDSDLIAAVQMLPALTGTGPWALDDNLQGAVAGVQLRAPRLVKAFEPLPLVQPVEVTKRLLSNRLLLEKHCSDEHWVDVWLCGCRAYNVARESPAVAPNNELKKLDTKKPDRLSAYAAEGTVDLIILGLKFAKCILALNTHGDETHRDQPSGTFGTIQTCFPKLFSALPTLSNLPRVGVKLRPTHVAKQLLDEAARTLNQHDGEDSDDVQRLSSRLMELRQQVHALETDEPTELIRQTSLRDYAERLREAGKEWSTAVEDWVRFILQKRRQSLGVLAQSDLELLHGDLARLLEQRAESMSLYLINILIETTQLLAQNRGDDDAEFLKLWRKCIAAGITHIEKLAMTAAQPSSSSHCGIRSAWHFDEARFNVFRVISLFPWPASMHPAYACWSPPGQFSPAKFKQAVDACKLSGQSESAAPLVYIARPDIGLSGLNLLMTQQRLDHRFREWLATQHGLQDSLETQWQFYRTVLLRFEGTTRPKVAGTRMCSVAIPVEHIFYEPAVQDTPPPTVPTLGVLFCSFNLKGISARGVHLRTSAEEERSKHGAYVIKDIDESALPIVPGTITNLKPQEQCFQVSFPVSQGAGVACTALAVCHYQDFLIDSTAAGPMLHMKVNMRAVPSPDKTTYRGYCVQAVPSAPAKQIQATKPAAKSYMAASKKK